ncbi:unnamed protein product [Camellia sinensis]
MVCLRLEMMDMTWINALLVGAGCFALGYLMSARHLARNFVSTRVAKETSVVDVNKKNRSKEPLEIEKLADILEDFKMVLVVRNDLKMGKGKIAAQCSHATLGLYKKLLHRAPKALNRWEMCGQVKVVVKIESEEDLLVLQEKAKSLNIPTHVTIDAGRTQIAPTSSLCEGIQKNKPSRKEQEQERGMPHAFKCDSRTVMAIIGPAEMVDDVTGGLKLL